MTRMLLEHVSLMAEAQKPIKALRHSLPTVSVRLGSLSFKKLYVKNHG
jgi:hypothetical protein